MSAINEIRRSDIPAPGTPIGGGFAVVPYLDGGIEYLLIDAGKAGDLNGAYGARGKDIDARSYTDGLANTNAMVEAGSELAIKARALRIGGADDWQLPASDQQELQYRYLKPTEQENYCSFRDGENPSAIPPTYPYTAENPTQTKIDAYSAGGAEAFRTEWHVSSTQYSSDLAWTQFFEGGMQDYFGKSEEFAARAVRRLKIIN